jgi:hypothetical protein
MLKTSKLAVSAALGLGLICSASVLQAAHRSSDTTLVAREASEGPRGGNNERPGDKRKRGGKQFEEREQVAREASEGPRGGDNERPGDKRRRGGRLFEQSTQIA